MSGPGLRSLLMPLLGREPEPRRALLANFLDDRGEPIDHGLALYFPGPHSYTGEDMLELQGHGGPAVLQRLLKRCLELGARLAEPGEFTRRAFLNGKLDLAQAESVADLIEARSEAAARSALRSLKGEFSEEIQCARGGRDDAALAGGSMHRFPGGGDRPAPIRPPRAPELKLLMDRVAAVESAARRGSLLREGARVALIGRPNVGKSSLLNRLAGEEVAIVTDLPGTTRDVIRQELLLDGVPIHVLDTAGLRDPSDPIERLGIERTRAVIDRADLVLFVADVRGRVDGGGQQAARRAAAWNHANRRVQQDRPEPADDPARVIPNLGRQVKVSALSGAGLDELRV